MLVRKFTKSKWIKEDSILDTPMADAITSCLRTTQNSLSVWKIDDENELDEAVLAIVSAQEHLEAIDVVILEDEYLEKKEFLLSIPLYLIL